MFSYFEVFANVTNEKFLSTVLNLYFHYEAAKNHLLYVKVIYLYLFFCKRSIWAHFPIFQWTHQVPGALIQANGGKTPHKKQTDTMELRTLPGWFVFFF